MTFPLALLGALTACGGVFLFLWYRTLAALPVRRQPLFVRPAPFKWGVPALALVLVVLGLTMLASVRLWLGAAGAAAALGFGLLVVGFDRYGADIRRTHHRYRAIRSAERAMPEIEVLFHLARERYPTWTHDRLVELVAGKDIESLILLMIIRDNQISPISDWELYRSLKARAARAVRRQG